MEADAYQRLRECELEIALQEARADLAAGRVVHESVDDHLKRLDAMTIGPDDEVQTRSHSLELVVGVYRALQPPSRSISAAPSSHQRCVRAGLRGDQPGG